MKALATTKDLMEKYQVTRGTINNWRKEGLPSIKIGGVVRFDIEVVDNWVETNGGE